MIAIDLSLLFKFFFILCEIVYLNDGSWDSGVTVSLNLSAMGRDRRFFFNQWGAGESPVLHCYWILAMSHKSFGVETPLENNVSILVEQAARLHSNSVLSRGYTERT